MHDIPKSMKQMHCSVPFTVGYWADPFVRLLPLKNSMHLIDPPVCLSNETSVKYVSLGESVALSCLVDANPSTDRLFKWTFQADRRESKPVELSG